MFHVVLMAMSSFFPAGGVAQVPPVVLVPIPVTSTATPAAKVASTPPVEFDSTKQGLGDGSGHFDPTTGLYESMEQYQAEQAIAHAGESQASYTARMCADAIAIRPWMAGYCA